MAKNVAGPRPKSGNGAGNAPAPAAEQPESLDQVRDILFGGQMRMVDTRLRSLEERIVLEQTTLAQRSQSKDHRARGGVARRNSPRTPSGCPPSARNAPTTSRRCRPK